MKSNSNLSTSINRFREFVRKYQIDRQTLLLVGVFIILLLYFGLAEDKFLKVKTITSMGYQLPELGVLSIAMMVTILVGGINLSVNATSNLAAVLAGFFLVRYIPPDATQGQIILYITIAIFIALIVGLVTGLINGLLVGYVGIEPILATLATLTLYTGISTGLTGGATVTGFPDQLSVIGGKALLSIPIPFLIFVIITVATYFLLYRTAFGFKVRMLGSNPIASNFSGIDNKSITMWIFIYSGILSAITGVITMSRTMSAAYEYGSTTYVLLTILIAVLAGIMPGFGKVIDIFLAVIILQILSTGFHMVLLGIRGSAFFKDFAWGVLLIIIFIINYFLHRKSYQE